MWVNIVVELKSVTGSVRKLQTSIWAVAGRKIIQVIFVVTV